MTISIGQAAINLALGFRLSALIGFERQWRNRLAGSRTKRFWPWAASFALYSNKRA